MKIIIGILIALAGIIVLLLIIALILKKDYVIKSEIIINAPRQKVFDYVKLIKNQDYYNKYLMKWADSKMKREFKGTDGTIGFIYSWSGDKEGEGDKVITDLVEGEKVVSEIRFVRPMKVTAYVTMTTEYMSDTQTKVTWTNASIMPYPFNLLLPFFQGTFVKDMNESLVNLKNILEK